MPVWPAMFSATAIPSSSALWASIGPGITSPIAQTPGTDVRNSWSVSIWPRLFVFSPIFSRPSPSVFGRRPIDTSTTSASIVSAVPPAARSALNVTALPLTFAPVTLVDRRNSKPCFLKILFDSLRTSPSMPGRIWSRNSTTVTCAPRRSQTDRSSSPITPPPMTTMCLGTCGRASAPVESTILAAALSTSTPGSGVTEEPVAMTMFLAVTVRSPTLTVFGPSKVPRPFSHSILFFLNRNSMPPVRPFTAVSLDSCITARSTSTPLVFTPHFASVDQLARALLLHRPKQGACCVAHLLLHVVVGVQLLMAGRIGLPIADVAVQFGSRAGRLELHEAQPVRQASADVLRALHIPVDDDREHPAFQVPRVGPVGEFQLLRLFRILAVRAGRVGVAA